MTDLASPALRDPEPFVVSRSQLEGDHGPAPEDPIGRARLAISKALTAGVVYLAEPGDVRRIDFWIGAGSLVVHGFDADPDADVAGSISTGLLAGAVLTRIVELRSPTTFAASSPVPDLPPVDDALSAVAGGALGADARLRWVGWAVDDQPDGWAVLDIGGVSHWVRLRDGDDSEWNRKGLGGLAGAVASLLAAVDRS